MIEHFLGQRNLDDEFVEIADDEKEGRRVDHHTDLDLAPADEPDLPRRSSSDSTAHAVIGTVVEMAHRAGAWVVAENIETPRQLQLLTQLNVDWGQGLFLGAPSRRDPSALT